MKTRILLALAAALFATAAQAEVVDYRGFYLGGFGGASYVNSNQSTPYSGGAPVGVTSGIQYKTGYIGGVDGGWSWGNGLRTELEYSYHSVGIDSVNPAGVAGADGGDITIHTVMANALYDLPLDWWVRPYAGLGVGAAFADYKKVRNLGGFTIDDTDTGLAWQGIAGLAMPITPRFSASLEYRWVATQEFKLGTTNAGVNSQLGYASHNAILALRYQFGEPVTQPAPMPAAAPMPVYEPAPAPVPAPTPAPAPRAVAPVVPQTYIVFFDFDKTAITPEAERVLQRAAQDVRVGQGARIHVVGHADRAGTARYNVRLSEKRAKVVHDRLVELGVNDEQIATRAMGESQNRVPTADGVREAQNRRAEIIFQ